MTDFDDMVIESAGALTAAFSSTVTGTYYPKGRPAIEDITIIYDSQLFQPDPLTGEFVEREPQISIETAALPASAKKDDRIDFKGIKVKVEHNEGDDMGMTTLRVRDITNEC